MGCQNGGVVMVGGRVRDELIERCGKEVQAGPAWGRVAGGGSSVCPAGARGRSLLAMASPPAPRPSPRRRLLARHSQTLLAPSRLQHPVAARAGGERRVAAAAGEEQCCQRHEPAALRRQGASGGGRGVCGGRRGGTARPAPRTRSPAAAWGLMRRAARAWHRGPTQNTAATQQQAARPAAGLSASKAGTRKEKHV